VNRRAIELEFYNGEHYANLARVYVAAGNRKDQELDIILLSTKDGKVIRKDSYWKILE